MKNIELYLCSLLIMVCLFVSCSDENLDCTQAMQDIQNQMKESDLLKSVVKEDNQYVFLFETNKITIPIELVESVDTDVENWKSTLTLVNGSTYIIPFLGTSIDKLVLSSTVNPSGCNPLSANVVLKLPVLGRIKLIVHSKPGRHTPDVEYTFKEIGMKQTIPVLGLYPNYDNQVTLVYLDLQGNIRASSDLRIRTEALANRRLPKDIRVVVADYEHMEPGMNLVNSPGQDETDTSIPYMVDADGEIRWIIDWEKSDEHRYIGIGCGLIRMQNGNYMTGDGNHHRMVEVDMMGNTIHNWDMLERGYTVHHAISQDKKGNILATVSKTSAKIASGKDVRINDFIIMMDPEKGEIIKEWDLVNMLDSTRYGMTDYSITSDPYGQSASNWAHNNGILEWGDDYLATARYQGIFKFNKAGGIEWIISPHKYWRDGYLKLLLNPLHADGTPITDPEVIAGTKNCDDFEWPWGCHTAVPLPNGHIFYFNNGYGRNFQFNFKDRNSFYTCGVEYEIDEVNRTVRQVWQYGKERGYEYFTPARSGVQYLEQTGNRLICPGMMNTLSNGKVGARVTEVDPKTQNVVFELELEDAIYQRVYRMPLYPDNQ